MLWQCLLIANLPFAQTSKPITTDSTKVVIVDTLQTKQSIRDSSRYVQRKRLSPQPGLQLPQASFQLNPNRRSEYLFQEIVQLASQTMPVIPVVLGEIGQPLYLATAFLPARVTDVIVDGIHWIPGVYGTADLTGLPEAGIDRIGINNISNSIAITGLPTQFHFDPDSLNFTIPFSDIEYAKGPSGADAVRIGFGRAFSPRLTGFFNVTLSNADQATNNARNFSAGKYDGHKAAARIDYNISSDWRARYRHFNTSNEAELTAPFFPEEWPVVTDDFASQHKEVRLYHSFELARARPTQSRYSFIRAYQWTIKEELNDPASRIQHHLRERGIEASWRWQREKMVLTLQPRVARKKLNEQSTIEHKSRIYRQLAANFDTRLTSKIWLQAAGHFRNKANFPDGYALSVAGIFKFNANKKMWLKAGHWQIPPAIAERDNTLPLFTSNSNLQAVKLLHAQAGFTHHNKKIDINLIAGVNQWQDGYLYKIDSTQVGGTTGGLTNSDNARNTFALQAAARYQASHKWTLGFQAAGAAAELPRHFWFWHQPQTHIRFYVERYFKAFQNKLALLPRLSGRFIGQRHSPQFDSDGTLSSLIQLPSTTTFDFQIRLQYGTGAVFFSWENLLSQEFEWRHNVPATGRIFRWGFWWTFLN